MKTIDEFDLSGKRVLIRVDFNVPIDEGRVSEEARIVAALPTIRYALDKRARVILASHLGRPKGKRAKEFSLAPAAARLGSLLGRTVAMAGDCVGPEVEAAVAKLAPGEVLVLENLRFHSEEESNDAEFAAALARLCDVYINDAFGAAHRAHASTEGIVRHVAEAGAGFLMQAELEALHSLLDQPDHPFVAIIGGAKVSDKIGVLEALLARVDSLLVGGAMAYTLLKAKGHRTGTSRIEEDHVEEARRLLKAAEMRNVEVLLPVDHVCARKFDERAEPIEVAGADIDDGLIGLDIGPETRRAFAERIGAAATVFWNGPMGVFEWDRFSAGTMAVAQAVADSKARSVVGGGDSVAALAKSGRCADITHVSTGGGASLELLEGRTLPGVAALEGGSK